MSSYVGELLRQFRDPWVWFGFGAQGLFFMRFFWQWIVSERHKRSTIPLAFWYFSIAGALCTLVYAAKRRDPVIMLAQCLGCLIYIRNLALIRSEAARRKLAGLPVAQPERHDPNGV